MSWTPKLSIVYGLGAILVAFQGTTSLAQEAKKRIVQLAPIAISLTEEERAGGTQSELVEIRAYLKEVDPQDQKATLYAGELEERRRNECIDYMKHPTKFAAAKALREQCLPAAEELCQNKDGDSPALKATCDFVLSRKALKSFSPSEINMFVGSGAACRKTKLVTHQLMTAQSREANSLLKQADERSAALSKMNETKFQAKVRINEKLTGLSFREYVKQESAAVADLYKRAKNLSHGDQAQGIIGTVERIKQKQLGMTKCDPAVIDAAKRSYSGSAAAPTVVEANRVFQAMGATAID